MRRFILAAVAAITAVALTAGASEAAPKAGSATAGGTAMSKAAAKLINTNRLRALNGRISNDTAIAAKPAGFSNLDALTALTCPGNANLGCVVTAEGSVQVGQSGAVNNRWAICPTVNGVILTCPFVGIVPTGGFFEVRHWEAIEVVAPGTVNTVRTQTFFDAPASTANYTVHYEIFRVLP